MMIRLSAFVCFLVLSGCASQPTGLVVNGSSYHINSGVPRNEKNYGAGLTFANQSEIGIVRNSRVMESSHSLYYLKYRDFHGLQVGTGLALYDNKGRYEWELKPLSFIGKRIRLSRSTYLNIKYMPHKLITANFGIDFGR